MSALRIAFFGTPEIAVPTLERLVEGPHEVDVVVSQPDRERGRGRKVSASPVARAAEREGIPLLRPEQVGDRECVAQLEAKTPDLGVVVAFGQFIPRPVRELPRLGYLINAHASLLPRHRGAAPIARAILAGDSRTGISVMRVEREMDAGPVALVRETAIGIDEEAGQLSTRLGLLAADAIADAIEQIETGTVTWTDQDPLHATLAPKLTKDDARLDFGRDAASRVRQVCALAPSPGAVTILAGEPLRILAATVADGPTNGAPGTAQQGSDGSLRVATPDGWLVPTRIQRAGGKPLETRSFLRGRPIPDGTQLGEELP
ncbi:MAG: methionyl-tRNA formyltransferase [Myxococcota bacterium]|nr:methionyl-tRNA formyltransferase [Myxococcota bacterium]